MKLKDVKIRFIFHINYVILCVLVNIEIILCVMKMSDKNSEIENSSKRPRLIDIRAARLVAVQCVYSYNVLESEEETVELMNDIVTSWDENKYFRFTNCKVNKEYLTKVLNVLFENVEQINQDIVEFISENIKLDYVSKVVIAVIQVATAEIYRKELDFAIIINEYLNIASSLNHDKDKAFINSVLDKIAKKYQ